MWTPSSSSVFEGIAACCVQMLATLAIRIEDISTQITLRTSIRHQIHLYGSLNILRIEAAREDKFDFHQAA